MATAVFKNGGNLYGAGNAFNSLAENLGTFGAVLQMANTRTIPFTPNANDIMQGAVIGIYWTGQTTTTVTVKLQKLILGVWTDIAGATKTLNGDQITNNLTNTAYLPVNNASGQFVRYFDFATPAAVTAVAGLWRLDCTVSTTSGNPYLLTSDGTNPFFVTVGSTATTYSDNNDQIVVVNSALNIDANCTFKGILSGTRGLAGIIGSSTNPVKTGTAMLTCSNGVTITTTGLVLFSSHSSPCFGTKASPISFTCNFNSANVGTAKRTGFMAIKADADGSSNISKMSWYMFGTVPAVEDTYLTTNVPVGAISMEVADTTGWVAGDRIVIGGQTTRGIGDITTYIVTSTLGKTVNFSPALTATGGIRLAGVTGTVSITTPAVWTTTNNHCLFVDDIVYFRSSGALPTGITAGQKYYVVSTPTNKTFQFSATLGGAPIATSGTQSGTHTIIIDKAAGRVIRLSGYGGVVKSNVVNGVDLYMGQPSNHVVSGVQFQDVQFAHSTNGGREVDFPGNQEMYSYRNSSYENTSNPTGYTGLIGQWVNGYFGSEMVHVNASKGQLFGAVSTTGGNAFNIAIQDCINVVHGYVNGGGYAVGVSTLQFTVERNHFESSNVQHTWQFSASVFNNNRFWGCNTSTGWFRINTGIDTNFYRNIFDNSANGYSFVTTTIGCYGIEDMFGILVANTIDMNFIAGYTQFTETNSPSAFVMATDANSGVPATVTGSLIRTAGYNGNPNDNRTAGKYGDTQSCGTGLSDTTARTSGGYSLRLQPTSGIKNLEYPLKVTERVVPTGNIQGKTMTISAWVNIANSAYASGVHVKPTLNVKYDNVTIVSAVAVATYGSWQQIAVTFTPLTAYGQVEMWFTSATDATGANRYWYVDDINVAYPAGVQVNLGGLDLYANALPVFPPIATVPALGGIWDEPTSAHTISGSFGVLAKDTEIKADDAATYSIMKL